MKHIQDTLKDWTIETEDANKVVVSENMQRKSTMAF